MCFYYHRRERHTFGKPFCTFIELSYQVYCINCQPHHHYEYQCCTVYIECNGHRLFVQCSASQCDGNWKQSEGSPVDRAGLFWLLESSRLKLYPLYSLNCTAVQWCSVHSTVLPCAVQQSEFSHSIHRICCRKCQT